MKISQDYKALAQQRDFHWLGVELPSTTHAKTLWRCAQNHEWQANYHNISMGSGCPYCAGLARKTPEDYRSLAESRGFVWLDTEVKNISAKTNWRCTKGHEWAASYSGIYGGNGCPVCAGCIPKISGDFASLAELRGFIWLGPIAKDTKAKTRWQCQLGHTWDACYNHISRGKGCPVCAGNKPKTEQDYHILGSEKECAWVGSAVPSVKSKTFWRCKNDHLWNASYSDVNAAFGCPYCRDFVNGCLVSRPQRAIHEMIGGNLNHIFETYRIDIAVEINGTPVAVEYDCWHWHKNHLAADQQRANLLIDRGWRFLRIKSSHSTPSLDQINDAIQRLLNGNTYEEIVLPDWGEKNRAEQLSLFDDLQEWVGVR